MANEEHLAILRKGAEEWNRWREENASKKRLDLICADLSGAHLSGADLSNADLRAADLSNADLPFANLSLARLTIGNLRSANLSNADLRNADLIGADLFRAGLGGADLSYTDLSRANLRGADLSNADLTYAHLRRCTGGLSDTHLSGAHLGDTSLVDIDLSEAKGLERVVHRGPSSLATSSLTKSKGRIPDAFLRGCGLTDWEIQAAKLYDPDLTRDERTEIAYEVVNLQAESPIVLHHVFISYSHGDTTFVDKLEAGLDKKRIRYWRDVHELKAGRLDRQIERAIRVNPLILIVLSGHSVGSSWVEWEVHQAQELGKTEKRDVLCPIALDETWKTCDWEAPLRRQIEKYNILDFSDPEKFDVQFEKLVSGIVENYPSG